MGAAVAWAPEPADPFAACHARFEQVLQVAGSQELPTGRGPAWSCKKLLFLRSFPTGRRPVLACKKQRSILYAGSDGARGGRRVIGVTPCWARTRFRSLVPGLVTLTLVRSRTGIVRSRSSRSEEYLSFTPRRAIHPSRRRTAGRHQTAIQFVERSFLTCLFLRRRNG